MKPCAGAYGALLDVVSDICFNAEPLNHLSGLGLHLFHLLVCTVEASNSMVEELGGMQTQFPFRTILASMDSSSWALKKWWMILRTCLRWSIHPLRVRQYRVLYTGSLYSSSDGIQFIRGYWMCLTFWWMAKGKDSYGRGSGWCVQLIPSICQAYIGWYSHTFACGETCSVDGEGWPV